jgi:hypothetical protein
MKAVRYATQLVLYVPLLVMIGYFSTFPRFVVLPEDQALVLLSFSHAGHRQQECRQRTPEELAKLAPNMRIAEDCPRERNPVTVELEIDGQLLYHVEAPPAGLRKDGASTVYRRAAVPAGRHRIVARLRDRASGDFGYVKEETIDIPAGASLVIDFHASRGGFQFRV